MAKKTGIPLSTLADFPNEALKKLEALWITTAEELAGAAALPGGLAGLAEALELPEDQASQLVDLALAALPDTFTTGRDLQRHGMGALDDEETPREIGGPPATHPLPERVDLHQRFAAVRNQGQRGTCVAHACAAVREFLTGEQSASSNFSEQFLYWACKKHDLIPGEGTFIRVGMNRLEFDGIPDESAWPYNPHPIAGNEGQDPPPAGAVEQAGQNKIQSSTSLAANNVATLQQALADGSPIAFSVPVYSGWFAEPTHSSGDVRLPLPGEKVEGGHAMCMVGYEVDAAVPGGGYFLVRNSWGPGWGRDNPVAAGHARIPFAFISQYGKSAYIAKAGPRTAKSFCQRFRDWLRELFG